MTLYVMIGLPGSGKSTIAEKYTHNIISTDDIREEFFTDDPYPIVEKRLIESLKKQRDVLIDATNLTRKNRRNYLMFAKQRKARTVAVVLLTPFDVCLERQLKRKRNVPKDVIKKYACSFQFPAPKEFDEVIVVQSELDELKVDTDIPQDNPHHTLSLSEHMSRTAECVRDSLKEAALNHDIGKVFTKTYINSHGEHTEEAHYYGHESFGAYYYLTSHKATKEVQHIGQLINYHMRPFVWEKSKKAYNRDLKEFGKDFMEELKELHEADKKAC